MIALAIAMFVAVRAILLGRRVADVHDLHVWQLISGMNVTTAHLVTDNARASSVLTQATSLLREKFGIAHATLQVESTLSKDCLETDW